MCEGAVSRVQDATRRGSPGSSGYALGMARLAAASTILFSTPTVGWIQKSYILSTQPVT